MSTSVLFVTDRRGTQLLLFSMLSMLLSGTAIDDIQVATVGFELTLPDAVRSAAEARGISVGSHVSDHVPPAGAAPGSRITATAHLKLLSLLDALAHHERVLYVDTDMLFLKPLALQAVDFGRHDLAAGFDIAEAAGVTDPGFLENCAENRVSRDYFNSGMLFAKRSLLSRRDELVEAYGRLARRHEVGCEYKKRCGTTDQCVLNLMFQDRWARLPLDWNVQSSMRFTRLWSGASVRHYTGAIKFLPLACWRSDRAEIEHVVRLARMLGFPVHRPLQPYDIPYRLNALRWLRGIGTMTSALDAIRSRA